MGISGNYLHKNESIFFSKEKSIPLRHKAIIPCVTKTVVDAYPLLGCLHLLKSVNKGLSGS